MADRLRDNRGIEGLSDFARQAINRPNRGRLAALEAMNLGMDDFKRAVRPDADAATQQHALAGGHPRKSRQVEPY
ncbi:MAG: hypothetical protein ACRD4Q_09605, partial [Candidatus Acidiferrales bacterium]